MVIKLLDLYCKAGNCSDGYRMAAEELGCEIQITGVDIEEQPNYPYRFIKADALEYLKAAGDKYTHIHASPPCQGYSRTKSLHGNEYAKDIGRLRDLLAEWGGRYVIENVPGAPMVNPVILDGVMFGLQVIRRRKFECNFSVEVPKRGVKKGSVGGKNCTRATFNGYYIVGGHQSGTVKEWTEAMGIMRLQTRSELAEAVPPAYTKWIGKYFLKEGEE